MGYDMDNAPVYRRARGKRALPVALLREALQVVRRPRQAHPSPPDSPVGWWVDIATDGRCQGARTAALRSQS